MNQRSCIIPWVIFDLKLFMWTLVITFFISLLNSRPLVTSDGAEWGLFSWCYKEEVYDALWKNESSQCHDILPGDSPAYYEVVRIFAVVSFVLLFWNACSVFVMCFCDSALSRVGLMTILIVSEVLPLLSTAVTLGILGTYYKDDHRWKDANPSLGDHFWQLTYVFVYYTPVSCCVSCTYIYSMCKKIRRNPLQFCKLCRPRQHAHTQRPTNADSVSSHSKKKMIILYTKVLRALKFAMKLSRSGTMEVNPLCHQPERPESDSNPVIRDCLAGPAKRPESVDDPTSDHVPVTAGQHEDAVCHNTDSEDRSCSLCIQQDGPEPSNHRADMDSPNVHCINQPQRTAIDMHCVTDPPNSHIVSGVKSAEELCMDRYLIVHM